MVPLVLDVDGSLLRTDLLIEATLAYLRKHGADAWKILAWAWQGRATLKRYLALHSGLDTATLPVNKELAEYARAEHGAGRKVGIATAADEIFARQLAERFDFIDFVIASDGTVNLKGQAKSDALSAKFGGAFSYAGNDRADLPVWSAAERIVLVAAAPRTALAAQRLGKPIETTFVKPQLGLTGWMKALRVHQWAKNALIFIPLLLSGLMTDMSAWGNAAVAFVALSIVASATYLANDIWDVADDRKHWSKCNRPIASGTLPITTAAAIAVGGLIGGLLLAAFFGPPAMVLVLLGYVALTMAYSLTLKRRPVVDTFALASLFTLRIILGVVAIGAATSSWLLVFSMFLFMSLALAKRLTEVIRSTENGASEADKIAGRGYFIMDTPFILSLGIASGMASIVVMVLYLTEEAFLVDFYANNEWLWGIPPVLFLWLARIWLVAQRGHLVDDPVVFAVRDRKSLILFACVGALFLMAWWGVSVT